MRLKRIENDMFEKNMGCRDELSGFPSGSLRNPFHASISIRSSQVGSREACESSYRGSEVTLVHVLAAGSRGLKVHVSKVMLSASLGLY